MNQIRIFSVFINETMFRSFFDLNPNLWPYACVGVDNRAENRGLPYLYNRAIEENVNDDCWLFFVHEDFEIRGPIAPIQDLDPQFVYGTFGVRLEQKVPVAYGSHTCSNKDGSHAVRVGRPVSAPVQVDAIDCQSVLIHTSLLRKHPELRFDENLSFDLYAEELCLKAQFRHGVGVRVFGLDFQHYSHGKITERYAKGLKYLAQQYPDDAVPGSCSFIGGRAAELEKHFQYNIQANS